MLSYVADCGRHLKMASVLDAVEPVLQEKVDIKGSTFLAQLLMRGALTHNQEEVIRVCD